MDDFDWMTPKRPPITPAKRTEMYRREVAERAGIFYRLGYPLERAYARLIANVAWDFEGGILERALVRDAIGDIVAATYARRPSR